MRKVKAGTKKLQYPWEDPCFFTHTHTQLKIPQKRLSIAAAAASGQSGSMNGGGGTTFFCAVNTSKGGTSSIGVDQ